MGLTLSRIPWLFYYMIKGSKGIIDIYDLFVSDLSNNDYNVLK